MSDSISTFDRLPNELLMDMFDYLPPVDLYHGFLGLNYRFNSLLQLLEHRHLVLDRNWRTETNAIRFFDTRITTLIVQHDEPIDFSFFPNIRALKLCRPTIKQCNAIQSCFIPNLKHFYINSIHLGHSCAQLSHHIFATSYPSLRTCRLEEVSNSSHRCSTSHPVLTNIQWTMKLDTLKRVLSSCPQLTHLQVSLGSNIQMSSTSNLSYLHTNLHRLDIRFYSVGQWWCNTIESLLSMLPNLQYLTLYLDRKQKDIEFPFATIGSMLTQYVPCLRYIRVDIVLDKSPLLSSDLNTIKQYHPLFIDVQTEMTIFGNSSVPHLRISSDCLRS
jgi:hypothetical protein